MSTITTTGSDQVLYTREDFDGQLIGLKSVGGYSFYLPIPKSKIGSWAIRSTEATITTSGLSGSVYAVADGTKFRVGEVVPVLNTSGTHVGSVVILSISGNNLTFSLTAGSSYTPASGDKLLLRRDSKIADGDISVIDTQRFEYILVKSESSAVDLVAEIMGTGVKKKS